MLENTAYISNENNYISFVYANKNIRFQGPYSLESIQAIKEWENGYLVVDAKYTHSKELIEDYIDLKPILSMLYIDSDKFLAPIEKVEINHVRR